MSFKVDTSSPVLVTGATGYVAGVLIQQLLEAGVKVHAAVRDPSNKDRLEYLVKLAVKYPGSIEFFEGDLLKRGSYAEGMKGCSVVFHTASPFTMDVADPMKDLIEPAVEGTKNVLEQANQTPSVKRVVLTSSCAAINTDASETAALPGGVFTEDVWNRTATLDYNPYYLSKTLAEQAAWVIAGSQNQWTMATINPSMIMGPGVKYHGSSESFSTMKSLGGGEMASGAPNFSIGLVDVRDVARAHIAAAYKEGVKGRHILTGHNTNLVEMANALKPKYEEYPLPSRTAPKFLVWALAPLLKMPRQMVLNNVDVPIKFDNTKSKEELGVEYHSLETTVQDMFQQLIDEGVVVKAQK